MCCIPLPIYVPKPKKNNEHDSAHKNWLCDDDIRWENKQIGNSTIVVSLYFSDVGTRVSCNLMVTRPANNCKINMGKSTIFIQQLVNPIKTSSTSSPMEGFTKAHGPWFFMCLSDHGSLWHFHTYSNEIFKKYIWQTHKELKRRQNCIWIFFSPHLSTFLQVGDVLEA